MDKTNVPDIRVAFRQRMHQSELSAVHYNALGDVEKGSTGSERINVKSTSTTGVNTAPSGEVKATLTGTPPLSSNGSITRRTSVHDIAMIAETQLMDEDFYNEAIGEQACPQNQSSTASSPKQPRKRSKGDINSK